MVLAVLLLLVPVLAAGGVWWWQHHEAADAEAERAEDRAVLNAATLETTAWATVDYRTVDDYVAKVSAGATGAFLSQFQQNEKSLRNLLRVNKSVQVPTIPNGGVGLLERKGDAARVLIAMDAAVTNKATKKPQPRHYRLQVTLQKEGGRWLTSGLEFIDAQQ